MKPIHSTADQAHLLARGRARLSSAALLIAAISAQAIGTNLTIQVLSEFHDPDPSNGPQHPYGRLVQGTNGDFYGTSVEGGALGYGTVFKINSAGTVTTLFSFGLTNGAYPEFGGLTLASDGFFYGNASSGGQSNKGGVFRINHSGGFSNLASFTGTNGTALGTAPNGWLAQGSDGNFYGTTVGGGPNDYGTIFKMTPAGSLTPLVLFTGTNGSNVGDSPWAGLVRAGDGNYYGVTYAGGSANLGTIFRVTTNGVLTTLVSFTGTNGSYLGSYPLAGLTLGADGRLYGSTRFGGSDDSGTIFRISTNGVFSNLYNFDDTIAFDPEGALVAAPDGKLYGTTYGLDYGGQTNNNGTVFSITTNGTFQTLALFDFINGPNPVGSFAIGNDGNLYGTTLRGGYDYVGNVFRLVTPPTITAITAGNGNATITWTSFTNGVYRVEYMTNVAGTNWTALVPNVTATGNVASQSHSPTGPLRCYRVVLLP